MIMKFIFPSILIVLAVALFVTYINPKYQDVQVLSARAAELDDALTRSRELIAVRDQLLSRYNTFSTTDIARLEKMLPDTVDNVRLIIDIDSIASGYGLTIRDVVLDTGATTEGKTSGASIAAIGPSADEIGTISLTFSVNASYDTFIRFLKDLERSLRLVDVSSLSFSANDTGTNQYTVSLKTYWLR